MLLYTVINKIFVIAACLQQHLSLIILGLSLEKVKKNLHIKIPILIQKLTVCGVRCT